MFFSSNDMNTQPIRVKTDFIARNHREITVQRGEVVEVNVGFCSIQRLLMTLNHEPNQVFKAVHLVSVCPQLLDKSKQWWKVRTSSSEEGYVPNNVLEAADEPPPDMVGSPQKPASRTEKPNKQKSYNNCFVLLYQQTDVIPNLTRRSKPPEVKAWLEDKGFSQM